MKTQDLETATIDFLLSSTTDAQRKQMLIECAGNNDLQGLQKLITAEPAIVRRAGEEALAVACGKGYLDIAARLHMLGVRIDGFLFDDSNPAVTISQYPLHCALENSHWDVAQWLIDNGAKVMHMPRVLGNMVNKAPQLFRHMLHELPYIAAYEKRETAVAGSDDKVMGDALLSALEVIAYNEYTAFATIALEEGLAPRDLYDVALKKHSYAILRDLYEAGYRPDAAQKAAHIAFLDADGNEPQRAGRVRELLNAWTYADNHQTVDEQTLVQHRDALATGFDAGGDVPAAIALARGGAFLREVAHLLPQAGIDLMLLQDSHGATLAETLAVRGELSQAFDPNAWRGDFNRAVAMHGALPEPLRAQVDMARVSAAFGRYRIGMPAAQFKLQKGGLV